MNTNVSAGSYSKVSCAAASSKTKETEKRWLLFDPDQEDNGESSGETIVRRKREISEYYWEMKSAKEIPEKLVRDASDEAGGQTDVRTETLGIGFLLTKDNMGYGMTASQVIDPDSDDTLIQVKVALGEGESKTYEVNLNEIDPRNATAIEMFAYCQYKDAKGEGVNSTFGSWNALKTMIDPVGGMEFNSIEDAATKKINWDSALAGSSVSMEKMMTGEKLSAADLLQMVREAYERANSDEEEKDWRNMSEEEWDKLLGSVDRQLEALREETKAQAEENEEKNKAELLTARSRMFHRENSVTDPETGELITSERNDRFFLTKDGASCESRIVNSRDGEREGDSWEVKFDDEETYGWAMKLLERIPEEDNTPFVINESFWKDFAAGEIDEDDFCEFYGTLDHGKVSFLKTDEDGNMYLDRELRDSKYAKYFNVPLGKIYTLEEMQLMWDQQVQANQGKKQLLSDDGTLTGAGGVGSRKSYQESRDAILNVPYGILAKDGVITYNGVTFLCDVKTNSINLGDCSVRGNCISIQLEEGGFLNVNRDNISELAKCMDMFSGEDKGRIIKAIRQDQFINQKNHDIDEMVDGIGDASGE